MENDTSRSATPDTKKDVLFLGEGDNVPDNQEIIGKLSLPYYLQFIVKSLLYLWGRLGIVMVQTVIAKLSQKLVRCLAFW